MSAAAAMQEKRLKPVLFKELAGGTLRRAACSRQKETVRDGSG